LLILSLPYG